MESNLPVRAADSPIGVDVKEGETYFWCSCGQSTNQPFCDGTHKGSSFTPVKYTAEESKKVFFCACKATKNPPLCDGSHKN